MNLKGVLLTVTTGLLMLAVGHNLAQEQTNMLAHVNTSFSFTVASPLAVAAPMFGPDGERCWAGPHWNPEFLHPAPGKDVQGAVFTIQHGTQKSIWVNTVFDLIAGRMQYVSFIPEALVSTIDVQLKAVTLHLTSVSVTYARTALSPQSNEQVQELAKQDSESGSHWRQAVEECLRQTGTSPR